MQMSLIPGYRALFGEPPFTYDQIVATLPSDTIIVAAIAMNAELSDDVNNEEVQLQLLNKISARFSEVQKLDLAARIRDYNAFTGRRFGGDLFERWFLLQMIRHELHNDRQFPLHEDGPEQERNLLFAYLLLIDELLEKQQRITEATAKAQRDEFYTYRMLWMPLIRQYQYNEVPYVPYIMFKLTCFLTYALQNFRPYLREYLNDRGLSNISQLLGSFNQVILASIRMNKKEFLPGLVYIKPGPGIDDRHLRSMLINPHKGNAVNAALLKKYPLYYKDDKGYMVIDRGFLFKKIFRGPFFELQNSTSLSKKMKFNPYSGEVSKKVLEDICFKKILEGLRRSKMSILKFDTDGEDFPDAWYLFKDIAFLFEFKAYLFPDELPESADFDVLKTYIDRRFIGNEAGKPKGISQLVAHIEALAMGKAGFDPDGKAIARASRLKIVPIICFDDFHFTLPGISHYLNGQMRNLLSDHAKRVFQIQPLMMVNLEILLSFSVRGGSFKDLQDLFSFYGKILKGRRYRYKRRRETNAFLGCFSSLDEVYHTIYFKRIRLNMPDPSLKAIIDAMNITQELLDKPV